jgi:hypothetical protein
MEPTRGRAKGREQGWKKKPLQTRRRGSLSSQGTSTWEQETLKTKDTAQTPEQKTWWTPRGVTMLQKGRIQERYVEVPG